MLTETYAKVLASINLYAVFGALPRLAELAPEAAHALSGVNRPISLRLTVIGGGTTTLVFTRDRVTVGGSEPHAERARLLFRSPAHLNAVVDGTAQPIPVAGIRGLKFLAGVFAPLSETLGRYLRPSDTDLADETFADAHRMLLLDVAVSAITVVANEDRSGRFSASHMADGDLDVAIGDLLRYRLRIRDHVITRAASTAQPARAVFAFADLRTAGDVLGGRESALACVGDGRIAVRGYIPLADNASRILDRVGQYLGK
ncbi:hypothetical protein ACI3KS_15845 [Microbacterium sp. ZW T5_45]|uniref:hypothetical protein n=1 Tax=Microbacterium sp. ZW T5_45 TaxID=3378080 RepID=UPI00385455F4